MRKIKIALFTIGFTLTSITSSGQSEELNTSNNVEANHNGFKLVSVKPINNTNRLNSNNGVISTYNYSKQYEINNQGNHYNSQNRINSLQDNLSLPHPISKPSSSKEVSLLAVQSNELDSENTSLKREPFFRNRRNVYSSLWAFASLNYLYADLVGLMDANILAQYQDGVVNGTNITPNFLTVAAGFMQIPIANVFLPHIIKNEKTLRWVQIASGTVMTLVQSGTLFVGKPTPYYALFSAFEIAATSYITIDAIMWKAKSNKRKM